MSILPILVAPHPILKRKADPVESVDQALIDLIKDMFETMYDDEGIGLAAPQIGVSKRLLVLDTEQSSDKERGNPIAFINPEIIWESEELRVYNEGCLSLPGMAAEIERPDKIRIKYIDTSNKEQEIDADGLLATCLQHEIDHLNGVLFVDHLSSIKRNIIMRKLKKTQKEANSL